MTYLMASSRYLLYLVYWSSYLNQVCVQIPSNFLFFNVGFSLIFYLIPWRLVQELLHQYIIHAHSKVAHNWIVFVGCGFKEFSEDFGIFHICSTWFKSGEHWVYRVPGSQPTIFWWSFVLLENNESCDDLLYWQEKQNGKHKGC